MTVLPRAAAPQAGEAAAMGVLHTEILCYTLGEISQEQDFFLFNSTEHYLKKGIKLKQIFKNM